jgi:hypothetical protein
MHFLDLLDILTDLLGLFEGGRDEKKKKRSSKIRQKRTAKVRRQRMSTDSPGKSSKANHAKA